MNLHSGEAGTNRNERVLGRLYYCKILLKGEDKLQSMAGGVVGIFSVEAVYE